ncbi:acyl-CoA dehydrogenase [Pseudomonas sp. C27(2019)]|uniref:acyl-CoA dehydrogenase C-terminal domain-containing protein n=1 Tax=Pseudomonas sp. C27(2019) TaxID=2604941 RepID=UPI0012470FD5|nr:acyl-CoA dehydrogenase C-terminal domain-containing protein [Pseudomonas sp. C27(2019)]QEY59737.1 acyl-CoA dehydrogenase [Pseudomonas sp. C27(2019)]
MSDFNAPLRDLRFVLHEVFNASNVWEQLPQLQDAVDSETADAILEEAAKVTGQLIAPLSRNGDEQGAQWDNGLVTTPDGFKEAYNTYIEGGWVGLSGNPTYGGMGMPKMLSVQFEEMLYAADSSFALYSALTSGACLAIDAHASEELKNTYLPPLYEGRWAGVMCLTEAHAGTDLGLIRTRATEESDGSYKITGSKIFITGGDQDLTENIIHLVLAKLPDAPAGARGISLFLVPKININADGSLGAANAVNCGSIEEKMGIKASSTCVINFDGATGYLVGEPNKGLAAMFTMMNYERLSIGIQGIGCAELSYQRAAAYARERIQSRAASGVESPEQDADAIIVHADVRRMLLTMKSMTEGGRAFACYVGKQLDIAKYSPDSALAEQAQDLVALLTPVTKAFFTDTGLESCIHGQQVFGGHGYVREWGQEQLVRDVRIAQIYEGTNGIQALDLAGRKLVANNGAFLKTFTRRIREQISQPDILYSAEVLCAVERLESVSQWLLEHAAEDKNEIGAASVEYLHLFGYVAYAWMWSRMANTAQKNHAQDPEFYSAKLATADFYFSRMLPRTLSLEASIKAGSRPLYGLAAEQF